MKILSKLTLATVLSATFCLSYSTPAQADSNSRNLRKAKQELRSLKKYEDRFRVRAERVSAGDQDDLKNYANSLGFKDSDSDGKPDNLEEAYGSDSCSGDSNGDGSNDGNEYEAKGFISNLNTGTKTFTLRGDSWNYGTATWDDGDSESNLNNGDCVEVEGTLQSGVFVAKEIKYDDDCKN